MKYQNNYIFYILQFYLYFIYRDYNASDIAIIREVYDSENSHEAFGEELERALEVCCKIIIIEPSRLGDETARWISVGNCLHKTAVISGISAIITGKFIKNFNIIESVGSCLN